MKVNEETTKRNKIKYEANGGATSFAENRIIQHYLHF